MAASQNDFLFLSIVEISNDSFASSEVSFEIDQSRGPSAKAESLSYEVNWEKLDALIDGWDACDAPSCRATLAVESSEELDLDASTKTVHEPVRRMPLESLSSVVPMPAKFWRSAKRSCNPRI